MGLHTLTTILEKRGPEFLDKFLHEKVIITEKLDTYRILFEKQDDKLLFFKKDNTPLNLIERTLTNVWEDAIIELTTIIGDTMLPEGFRFGIAYTPVEKPIRLPYKNVPKYILTDVTLRKNNKVSEVFEYDEVTNWASMLNLGRPPIIFEGNLTDEQITTLKLYDSNKYDELDEDNFGILIENLFGKTYSEESIIEGIIIKNGKDLAQIVSYEFKILNEAYDNLTYSRDYYDIILLNVNSFLDTYKIPVLEGTTSDEMYLEIVSDIFNNFCKNNPSILENVKPNYLTPPSYGYFGDLNLLLINNKDTLKLLENGGKIYEALFRIIVSALRKPKKPMGLLNESAAEKFNSYVAVIKELINEEDLSNEYIDDYINEMNEKYGRLDESSIDESRSDNVVIDAINARQPSDVDNMRVISSIQKAFEPIVLDFNPGKEKAAIYITECQPFTNSQQENIIAINKRWKVPVILVSISNKRRIKGEKFHLSDNLIKAQLDSVGIYNKGIVPAFFMIDSWDLSELFEFCRPKYEPIILITDNGKKSDFSLQLYFEDEVMGGRISAGKEFNIGELDNELQLPAFRSIEDGIVSKFKEYTPEPIWNFYDSMLSEYKTWSGQFIEPKFKETNFI